MLALTQHRLMHPAEVEGQQDVQLSGRRIQFAFGAAWISKLPAQQRPLVLGESSWYIVLSQRRSYSLVDLLNRGCLDQQAASVTETFGTR